MRFSGRVGKLLNVRDTEGVDLLLLLPAEKHSADGVARSLDENVAGVSEVDDVRKSRSWLGVEGFVEDAAKCSFAWARLSIRRWNEAPTRSWFPIGVNLLFCRNSAGREGTGGMISFEL